jgi:hypothetical protein
MLEGPFGVGPCRILQPGPRAQRIALPNRALRSSWSLWLCRRVTTRRIQALTSGSAVVQGESGTSGGGDKECPDYAHCSFDRRG